MQDNNNPLHMYLDRNVLFLASDERLEADRKCV